MIPRHLAPLLKTAAAQYPIVSVTGPRQSGKTTLVRATFPAYDYVSLEAPDHRAFALDDPRGFLRQFDGPVILDEVQKTPEMFSYLQGVVDEEQQRGRFILTGSHNFLLLEKISQSLAGRCAIHRLLPLAVTEIARRAPLDPGEIGVTLSRRPPTPGGPWEVIHRGGYPRLHEGGLDPHDWLRNYYQTYLERDVREVTNVGDPEAFARFVRRCAGRCGQLLNLVALANDCGISHTTNQSGTASITLTLTDDGGTPGNPGDDATSPPQTFTITVNAVNNPPTFIAGPNQTVNEDAGPQTVSPWTTAIDDGDPESIQTVSFNITGNTNSGLFSSPPAVSPTGTLTYTPAANAFGAATIMLVLQDNGGTAKPGDDDTSDPQSFTITINAVNDPPSFTVGPNQSVLEDAGPQTVSPWATAISPGPANESGQTVSFNITAVSGSLVFSAGPAVSPAGVLTYTPAPNANGSASIMLVIQDSGGGADNSAPQGFSITVIAVNDPPQVTPPAAYPAHAHIAINIPDGATDLFDGSTITDVDGPGAQPFSITAAGPFASTNGGSVTIAGNGSFSYNPPPPGFTSANDTFTFQICDSGVPGSACTNATATIAVSGPRVWFVDNTVGSSGDGRLSSPFNTLAAADVAANTSGDRTFVFTGTGNYTGGFGLLLNQRLIGQGVQDTNFDTALGITPPATSVARPGINGTRPTINGTVTLATGSTARGFNVNNTTVNGVTGSGATGLTVNQMSVTTTTGVAVNLLNSGGTVSFQSVSANGAANGIVLNTTTGSFTVTGTGAAGTGGTIQNTTGDGILLTSAQGVSLSSMNIQNTNEDGIFGTTVTGLDLNGCSITGSGDDSEDVGIRVNNLLGSATWTNLTVTGSELANVFVHNDSGTLSAFTISGGSYSNLGTAFGGNSILIEMTGTAILTSGSVSNATISNNGLARGITVQAQGCTAGVGCPSPGSSQIGDAVSNSFTVQNCTFTNNGLHASFEQSMAANHTFRFLNNPTMTGAAPSHAINVASSSTSTGGTLRGRIQGNTIGNAAVAGSGSTTGNGIRVFVQGRTVGTLLIDGNVIRQTPQARGIDAQFLGPLTSGQPLTQSDITVTNNDVNPQDSTGFPLAAIYAAADSQGNSPVRVRSDVRLNTVPVGAPFDVLPTYLIFDEVVAAAEAQLVDTAPASANCTAQLTSTNTGSASGASGCALIAGPINTPP